MIDKNITLTGIIEKPGGYYDVRNVIVYSSYISSANDKNIGCEAFNKSITVEESSIPDNKSERIIIGSERLYFHSAPIEECKAKDLFIVPGDKINATSDYGKFTLIKYNSKSRGVIVTGWVYTDKLKPQVSETVVDKATTSQLAESSQISIIGQWGCPGEDKKFTFEQDGNLTMDAVNSGQHMYLHGSYAQSNANIKMTYNSIGTNSRNVPLPSPQYDKAQVLSPDKVAVISSDAKTGEDYPPYYCNKTTTSTSSARSPAPTIAQDGDTIERYANTLANQLENSPLPACQMMASSIRQFANSGAPDNVRTLQIDAIVVKPQVYVSNNKPLFSCNQLKLN